MPFNISTFRSALVFGGARQNLFEVHLTFPSVAGGSANSERFTFMCKAGSLPGSDIGSISVPYFGRQIKVPGDRQFPEWNVTIINDEDFKLRNSFEQWMNGINSHRTNIRSAAMVGIEQYSVDATVVQFSKTGQSIKEYSMIGCWPSLVAPINVGWADNDAIEEFEVTFQYQWWQSAETTT